jgi:hypothetical protein
MIRWVLESGVVMGRKKDLVGLILAGIDASSCRSAGCVENKIFKPTSKRHGNDINRHQTDQGTTGSDFECDV